MYTTRFASSTKNEFVDYYERIYNDQRYYVARCVSSEDKRACCCSKTGRSELTCDNEPGQFRGGGGMISRREKETHPS